MKNVFFSIPICIAVLTLLGCETNPTALAQASDPPTSAKLSKPIDSIAGVLPAGYALQTLPASYTTVTENVVIVPARVEYVTVPAEYEWVEGDIKGFVVHHIDTTSSQTRSEKYLYQEASSELLMASPVFAEDGAVVKPAMVIEQSNPAIYKTVDIKRWVSVGPAVQRTVPYEYKDGKTRIAITQPQTVEKFHPPVLKQIGKRKVLQPPTYIIRDETGQPIHRYETAAEVLTFLRSVETP